jgi:predicted amidophosphoribosyltransferase
LAANRASGRGVRGWLAEAGDAIVSVFFPAGCRICDKLLVRASRVPFCEECLDSFEAPAEKKCVICGQSLAWMTLADGEPLVCRACQQKMYAFERARSYGVYDGALVRAILLPKWERMEPSGSRKDWRR